MEQVEDDKPLIFTATVEVRPRLELSEDDYRDLKVERPDTEVTDDEIDEWVDRLRERFAELEPVERPAQAEDFVTIDLRAPSTGRRSRRQRARTTCTSSVRASSGRQLDEELEGKRGGDILKFNDVLPARFGEPHGGNEVDLPGAGEGREGAQASRRKRRVCKDGVGVRHARRSSETISGNGSPR